MRKKSLLLCSAAVASLLLTACQMFPAEEELPAAPVIRSYEAVEYTYATVVRGDLIKSQKISCEYVPAKKENHCFVLGGERIDQIFVTEGEQVTEGTVLAQLQCESYIRNIETQEYDLQVLELKREHLLENQKLALEKLDLQDASSIKIRETTESYEKQLQSIDDSLYVGRLRLQELQKELKDRQLIAGFDGSVIYARSLSSNERSVESRIVVTVADMESTAFVVKGEDAAHFPVGTQVTITQNKEILTAKSVEAAELGLTDVTSDEPIAYLKLDHPDPTLESGDRGSIEVVLDSRTDVLYLDRDAIKTAEGKQFVYILDENGLKVMHDVTVGLVSGDFVEITSGLSEGDSVILE